MREFDALCLATAQPTSAVQIRRLPGETASLKWCSRRT
jgi:hypothetical protein